MSRPTNNLVLICPRIQNDKITLGNGAELFVDNTFEPEKHANIVADVVEVPDELFFVKKGHPVSTPWETIMEVRTGDVAYCNYLAITNAINNRYDGKAFIRDGKLHLLVRYDAIFMVLRGELPIMCNGYILAEPTYQEYFTARKKFENLGLEIPDVVDALKDNTQYGIVRYVGSVPTDYQEGFRGDNLELKVGDHIFFDVHSDIPLEYEYHQTFEKGKKLFRIHRKDVLMVL